MSKMQELYQTNKDLQDYIDRYCKNYVEGKSISVEEALEHDLVKQVAEQYLQMEEEQKNLFRP